MLLDSQIHWSRDRMGVKGRYRSAQFWRWYTPIIELHMLKQVMGVHNFEDRFPCHQASHVKACYGSAQFWGPDPPVIKGQ